jgi:hypothetical protein
MNIGQPDDYYGELAATRMPPAPSAGRAWRQAARFELVRRQAPATGCSIRSRPGRPRASPSEPRLCGDYPLERDLRLSAVCARRAPLER